MDTQLYPLETMYRIGNGDSHKLNYDFSFIPYNQYHRFFNSLPNVIYKKCENIRFCCDYARQYATKNKANYERDPKTEQIIEDSIAGMKPKFVPYLVKILGRVLPRSKNLQKIHISSIKFPGDKLDELIDAITSCPTIIGIYFSDVDISDRGCMKLMKQLSPYQIEKISLKRCGISSRSYKSFVDFLDKPPQRSTDQKKIRTITIEGSTMTDIELDNIDYLLNGDDYEEDEYDDTPIDNNPKSSSNSPQKPSKQPSPNNQAPPQQTQNQNQNQNQNDDYDYYDDYDDQEPATQPTQPQPQPKPQSPVHQPLYSEDTATMDNTMSPTGRTAPQTQTQTQQDEYEYDYEEDEPQQKNTRPPVAAQKPQPKQVQQQQQDEYDYEYEEDEPQPQQQQKPQQQQQQKQQPQQNNQDEYEYEYEDEEPPQKPQQNPPQRQQQQPQDDEYEYEEDEPQQQRAAPPQRQPQRPPPRQQPQDDEYEYEEEENEGGIRTLDQYDEEE